MRKKIFVGGLFGIALLLPLVSFAAASRDLPPSESRDLPPSTSRDTVMLNNPLGNIDSFEELVSALLDAAFIIGLPIAVLFIVLAGARFVLARGNEHKLSDAKLNLQWTVIGIGIFFGAWTFAKIIESTIKALGVGS